MSLCEHLRSNQLQQEGLPTVRSTIPLAGILDQANAQRQWRSRRSSLWMSRDSCLDLPTMSEHLSQQQEIRQSESTQVLAHLRWFLPSLYCWAVCVLRDPLRHRGQTCGWSKYSSEDCMCVTEALKSWSFHQGHGCNPFSVSPGLSAP